MFSNVIVSDIFMRLTTVDKSFVNLTRYIIMYINVK